MEYYVLTNWPDIQDFMERVDYKDKIIYDPDKNIWAVPKEWYDEDIY